MGTGWATVRHRFPRFAGTFVAVFLGVAVVAGAATLHLSSQPQAPARYGQSPVLVTPPDPGTGQDSDRRAWTAREAAGLAARLGSLPGVTAAVADPWFYVQRLVAGRATGDAQAALVDGHSWSSAALGGYRLTAGRPPRTGGEVAVAGLSPGATTDVLTSAGPEKWLVTGTVSGPGFYVADHEAARRASGVHVIGLTLAAGAGEVGDGAGRAEVAAVRAEVGAEGVVRAGADRDSLEPDSVTRIRWLGAQLLIALVMLGAFATVFVVSSTCALSAAQRRRELGLLRAIGATPGQVRRLMYTETALIALFAGLLGAPAGAAAAPLLAEPMVGTGLEPAGFAVTSQPTALAGAILLGLVVALAGVAAAARRASRIPPLDALREAAADPRAMTPARWVAGPFCAVAGAGLLASVPALPLELRSTAGLGAAMLLLTAAALLSPVLIVPLVRVIARPWRNTAIGMLVRESTLTGVRRVASTAAPVLATVGFTVLLAGTVATAEAAVGIDESAKYPAGTLLVPDGTPGLSAAAVTAQGAEPTPSTRLLITHGGATTGVPASGSVTGPAGTGDGPAPGGEFLVLDRYTAAELDARAGDVVRVRFADGAVTSLPVRAVGAEVQVPVEMVRRHDPDALTRLVVLEEDAVAVPGGRFLPVQEYVREEVDEEGRLVDLFLVALIGLTAGYTGIAVGNTLLMATAARRPEFGALRLAGAGTGQVLRIVTAETLLAVLTGAVLGTLVAVISLAGIRAAFAAEVGAEIALVIPWTITAAVTAICAALATAAAIVPVLRRG
ncbi:permease [Actinoplanes utahensis]|uniref:Permease n=1 Tax=Actinoplanes utahensis TaxID=1869 RepID=A0A0A6U881_ACTUT|nr:permease [Actinoplanes utahensis]